LSLLSVCVDLHVLLNALCISKLHQSSKQFHGFIQNLFMVDCRILDAKFLRFFVKLFNVILSSRVLQGSSEDTNHNDGGPEFAEVFVIVWIGAMVVTLNSKLLGGNM
jgi:hypothetical protein